LFSRKVSYFIDRGECYSLGNFEDNKIYFGRYLSYVTRIERLTERYNELSLKMRSTHSRNLDGMPKGNRKYFMEDDIVELDEIKHRINSLKDESLSLKREITNALDHLENPDCSAILEERFIYKKTMSVIAEELHLSDRQTARLYSQAMNKYRFGS